MSDPIYELKHPFDYAILKGDNKGNMQAAGFITMFAPSFKQIDRIAPITQAFTSAISDIRDKTAQSASAPQESDDASEDITGQQVMQLMYNWSGDMVKVFLHAEQLFKSGVVLIEGGTILTSELMGKMQVVDFEGLVGAYIANFIAPSLMDGQ